MNHVRITLKPGRERSVLNGNPWIFSGAAASIEGVDTPGQPCNVVSARGDFLATGYVNTKSKILCRIMTRTETVLDRRFLQNRIDAAASLREHIMNDDTTACRLVNSEGDFLPGLVVDRYGAGLVVQILTAGMEALREDIIEILAERFNPSFLVERSDTGMRFDEGLEAKTGVLLGTVDDPLDIRENGLSFRVDVLNGQKTGFYLDQRDSRNLVRLHAKERSVLNLFSYTGGFGVYAASAGAASVTSVDSSAPALELAKTNMILNGFDSVPQEFIQDDVFHFLNKCDRQWDVIILDPPPFARKKSAVDQAARGYKDINMRALSFLNPGGVLATFSCSHHIAPALFRQIAYSAAADSGRDVQTLAQTGHAADHPFNLCHIEGEYLKGLFLRVID